MAAVHTEHDDDLLVSAGLPAREIAAWRKAAPAKAGRFTDKGKFSAYWQKSSQLLGRLPPRADMLQRSPR